MAYPKKCADCGEEVKPMMDEEEGLVIPTCVGCGEGYLDGELIMKLEEIWNKREEERHK